MKRRRSKEAANWVAKGRLPGYAEKVNLLADEARAWGVAAGIAARPYPLSHLVAWIALITTSNVLLNQSLVELRLEAGCWSYLRSAVLLSPSEAWRKNVARPVAPASRPERWQPVRHQQG